MTREKRQIENEQSATQVVVEKVIANARGEKLASLLKQSLDLGKGHCSLLSVEVGPGCNLLVKDDFLRDYIMEELIANSVEKDAEDIQVGLHLRHDAASGRDQLIVVDNVTYPVSELKKNVDNLNSRFPKRKGKSQWRKKSKGGFGIPMLRNWLGRWKGTLHFEATADNNIAAVAEWEREFFLQPVEKKKMKMASKRRRGYALVR